MVFAEHMPSEEVSFKNYRENGQRIQQIMQDMVGNQAKAASKTATAGQNARVRFVEDASAVPGVLLTELKVDPNVRFATPQPNIFFHQFDIGSTSFFFFRNPDAAAQDARVTLAAGARIPQIWNPWTGEVVEAPVYRSENGNVTLNIHLNPFGSELIALAKSPQEKYVVHTNFSRVERTSDGLFGIASEAGSYHTEFSNGKGADSVVSSKDIPLALTLGPNWDLKLVGNDKNGKEWTEQIHGAPLQDWSLSQNLRYFSGHGHYSLDVEIAEPYLRPGLALELDLGEVHDVAEVWINGKKINSLLMRPYRLDVAPYLKEGANHFEIVVVNTLRNRLVGDGMAGDTHFVMFQRRTFFMPSGLIGPVRLLPEARVKLP